MPGTPVDVPYKYTGKELDATTGLYFYEARYYDPVLGRFLSADTIVPNPRDPQSLNRYSYARNNPIMFNDPSGHFFKGIFKGIRKFFKKSVVGRVVGWIANPFIMQFTDPTTSQYSVPATAGIIGNAICGPACGGAASGAVRAYLFGGDIGTAAWQGAAAATAGAVAGGVLNVATNGDYLMISVFVGGAAGGATSAGLAGGNVKEILQASLIQGSVAAISVYIQYQGVPSSQAQAVAQEQKDFQALKVNSSQEQPKITSRVIKSTINVDKDGVLSFTVKTEGLGSGSFLGGRVESGFLPMDNAGINKVNFRTFSFFPQNTVNANGLVNIQINIGGIQAPAYLRIVPDYIYGQAPPGFAGTGTSPGRAFLKCTGAVGCGVSQNYDQPY